MSMISLLKTTRTVASKKIELFLFACFSLAIIALSLLKSDGPLVSNDGVQYLSVANNVLAGNGFSTSVIHFDEQYFQGKIPAKQTVFPPGYSIATALVQFFGIRPSYAGLVISASSAILSVIILQIIAEHLSIQVLIRRAALVSFILNTSFAHYSTLIGPESLFILLHLVSILCLMRAERNTESRTKSLVLAGLFLGLGCYTRYAGYFFVLTSIGYFGFRFLVIRKLCVLKSAAIVLATCLPFVFLNIIWNINHCGDWRGTSTKAMSRDIIEVFTNLGISAFSLLRGSRFRHDFFPFIGVAELTVTIAAFVALVIAVSHSGKSMRDLIAKSPTAILFFHAIGYMMSLIYTGSSSVVSFDDPRLLYPIFPDCILLIGSVLSSRNPNNQFRLRIRVCHVIIGISLLGYIALHTSFLAKRLPPRKNEIISKAASQPIGGFHSLRDWFNKAIPAEEPVLSGDGQLSSYYIGWRAISMVTKEYSSTPWTEKRVLETMTLYKANTLILFVNGPETKLCASESSFLSALLDGNFPPWLELVSKNDDVMIYQSTSKSNNK